MVCEVVELVADAALQRERTVGAARVVGQLAGGCLVVRAKLQRTLRVVAADLSDNSVVVPAELADERIVREGGVRTLPLAVLRDARVILAAELNDTGVVVHTGFGIAIVAVVSATNRVLANQRRVAVAALQDAGGVVTALTALLASRVGAPAEFCEVVALLSQPNCAVVELFRPALVELAC